MVTKRGRIFIISKPDKGLISRPYKALLHIENNKIPQKKNGEKRSSSQ
jgi:hypothetical protein